MHSIVAHDAVAPRTLDPQAKERLIEALYAVHCRIFDGVDRASFAKYVVDSSADHTWIYLHRDAAGRLVGYFALHVFEKELDGAKVAILRAEAGTTSEHRGGNINSRLGLELALRYKLAHPGRKMFYLGSLVHPSSYSLFASYADAIWPSPSAETPAPIAAFMRGLADTFHLEAVDGAESFVRKVGWRTRDSRRDRAYWLGSDKPAVRFFLAQNPGYVDGNGLLTLVPLGAVALLGFARRYLTAKLRRRAQRLLTGARAWRPAAA